MEWQWQSTQHADCILIIVVNGHTEKCTESMFLQWLAELKHHLAMTNLRAKLEITVEKSGLELSESHDVRFKFLQV